MWLRYSYIKLQVSKKVEVFMVIIIITVNPIFIQTIILNKLN